MRVGDIVTIPNYSRRGVALYVSRRDIRTSGINVRRPGIYIFSGYWHGTDPLNHNSYGKIHGQTGITIGQVRNHQQIARLCK